MATHHKSQALLVGDCETHYTDSAATHAATPNAPPKKTLLLVHGFPLDRRMWHEQIEPLSQVARVIAPDLRGFGQSAPGERTLSMEQLADDLVGLLDALDISEPIVLCGLSMGGYVAFQFWQRHAQRLAGLILCDTKASADSEQAAAARETMALRVLEEGSSIVAEAMLPKLFHPGVHESNPGAAQLTRETMLHTSPRTVAAAQRAMAVRQNFTPLLPRIDAQTLVVVGEDDAIATPTEMKQMAGAMPRAEFIIIPNAGHMAPLENPIAFNAAVRDFLARV